MGKKLKLRREDVCETCGSHLPVGTEAYWYAGSKQVRCVSCGDRRDTALSEVAVEPDSRDSGVDSTKSDPPVDARAIDYGTAGASALREHNKRSARERRKAEARVEKDQAWRSQVREEHPILGRLATALTPKETIGPESQATRAWKTGAEGEARVAEVLASSGAIAMHDRRIPGSKANIDHIAVGPNGVYVIDAKKYTGRIERRDKGSFFTVDERLFVNARDQTKLIEKLGPQCDAVRAALGDRGERIATHPVLCFIGAEWPLVKRPIKIRGTVCIWPKGLPKLVDADGPLTRDDIERLAATIAAALPPA